MTHAAASPRAGVPPVEVLRGAQEAMTTINNSSDTWEDALDRIKWVKDDVSSIAEVRYNILNP